ncbi:unnamed protein product [Candidula unifasciata]|uniref:P/Homo B domain-containing protein n=1 Tax=Candidula unifasciata TaxID=100452 RepID=A0A8S3ZQJ7_9EUPU|nr:unnamed protein product [Candidula unifasciata]
MSVSCLCQVRGSCVAQQDMTSIFISIIVIFITIFIPSCSFPLRHVGGEKKAMQHSSGKRDLILCWVMQVRRREMACHCDLEGDQLVADKHEKLKSGTKGSYRLGQTFQQQPASFSSEVGLHLVHTFEQFHDHFLFCLVDIIASEDASYRNTSFQSETASRIHNLTQDLSHRNPTSRKFKSEIMSQIHRLHADFKSTDRLLFDSHKKMVENRLQQHDEVLWFSSEYVHHHHSRSQSPELRHLGKLQHAGMQIHLANREQAQYVGDTGQPKYVSDTGQPQYVSDTGQPQYVSDTGQPQYVSDTRQPKYVSDTGQPQYVSDTGQPQYVSDTGQPQYVSDTRQPQYVSDTRQPKYVSDTGQPKYVSDTGQPKYVSDTGQPQYVSDTGQPQYVGDTGQPKYVSDTGQPQYVSDRGQTQYVTNVGQVQFIRDTLDPKPVRSQSDYNQDLLLLKNSLAQMSDTPVHDEASESSGSRSMQPFILSKVDDLRQIKKYSLNESHLPDQLTQSSDNILHRNKSMQFSVPSVSKQSVDVRFNDPMFLNQWHLVNSLTTGMDLNVTGVWMHNYTGYGVTVAVVDDGLEWMNPDLKANYNHEGSWDMNDDDPDPTPNANKLSNHHGTRCAGEIAAVANNSICGVGVAYQAHVSEVLDGLMTDSMEAEAFNMKMDINDIYSCSWGPDDDGRTVDGPHLMAAKALQHGVDFGRRGYGSIYVLASGNGGENQDNCNFDGYANSIYTVTIGAVDDKGSMPYYAEECASMLGVTFSSGTTNKRDIVTTDWTFGNSGGCTESHTGTSAAAPLAAAMIALMLQARPCLSWRDVQYIIILTAHMVNGHSAHSQKNGAGLSHSHKHGFGLLNSWRLVNAARVWQAVPWLTSYSYAESDLKLVIPKGKNVSLTVTHVVSDSAIRGLSLFTLENVQLTLTLSHPCRGKIGVTLTSPAGTISVLAAPRPKDNSTDGFHDWTFTSVRCWGEPPTGSWTFNITDHDYTVFGQGWVTKWRLTLFGTSLSSQEFADRRKLVESSMSGYFFNASALPCPPPPRYDSVTTPVSDRILKVLILCGAFCFIMAVYETFEYMLCYNDEKQEAARTRRLVDRAQELTHTTRVLDSDDHQLSSMSNGTSEPNHAHNLIDDEDDIFDASETSRLLTSDRRCSGHAGVREQTEDIPLKTFSIQSAEHSSSQSLPLPLATGGDNSTGEDNSTLNMQQDHSTESLATSVTSNSMGK